MTVVGTAVVLGLLVVLLLRVGAVRFGGAVACVVFGLVLGATPVGPEVSLLLDAVGAWAWSGLVSL